MNPKPIIIPITRSRHNPGFHLIRSDIPAKGVFSHPRPIRKPSPLHWAISLALDFPGKVLDAVAKGAAFVGNDLTDARAER